MNEPASLDQHQRSLLHDESKYSSDLMNDGKEDTGSRVLGEHSLESNSVGNNRTGGSPLAIVFFDMTEALGPNSGFTVQTFLAELRELQPSRPSVLSDQDISRVLCLIEEGRDTTLSTRLLSPPTP